MDGTLVDSEVLWDTVLRSIVENAGKTYDPEAHKEILGIGAVKAMTQLKARFGLRPSVDELVRSFQGGYEELIKTMAPAKKHGIDQLLAALKEAGTPIAVATSLNRRVVDDVLRLCGWTETFGAVVSGDEVDHPKPAPDVYLKASRLLNCDAGLCVAFEDSPNGVKSAKAAGMKVIGIVDPRFSPPLVEADRQIKTFDEVTVDDLKQMA